MSELSDDLKKIEALDAVMLTAAERIVVRGKTLLEWSETPHKLEVMSEHEFDDELREQMVLVYRKHCMETK